VTTDLSVTPKKKKKKGCQHEALITCENQRGVQNTRKSRENSAIEHSIETKKTSNSFVKTSGVRRTGEILKEERAEGLRSRNDHTYKRIVLRRAVADRWLRIAGKKGGLSQWKQKRENGKHTSRKLSKIKMAKEE